jgi:hypothetical protein
MSSDNLVWARFNAFQKMLEKKIIMMNISGLNLTPMQL